MKDQIKLERVLSLDEEDQKRNARGLDDYCENCGAEVKVIDLNKKASFYCFLACSSYDPNIPEETFNKQKQKGWFR